MKIGPTFYAELQAAGLAGLPFSWGEDGLFFAASITPEQRAAIEAVLAAHDPAVTAPDRKDMARTAITNAGSIVELKQAILQYLT